MAGTRILVVGAGVLGTVYAAKLALAGHDVTVAERSPRRLSQMLEHGLVIEPIGGGARESVHVPVVAEIEAAGEHDIALAIVRKTHLASVLAALAATRIPTLFFMVSNAAGPQAFLDAVGDRAVLGFPGAGGERSEHVVRYSIPPRFMQRTMLGEIDGSTTPRIREIADLLGSAGFATAITPNLDAWLKSHETFVAATANATYVAGGDGRRLARDRELLRLCIRSIRELYTTLDTLRIPVLPGWFRSWQRLPMPVIEATFGRFLASTAWQLGTDQINSMRDEVEVISDELTELAVSAGAEIPAFRELVRRRIAMGPV